MKRLALILAFSAPCFAQTLTLNDASVTRANPSRAGLNIGAIDYYDNGQLLKNLFGTLNVGFEPQIQQVIWNLASNGSFTGTTTSFTEPDVYDGVPANYWAGGTFTVVASQSGGTTGCSGTIVSNTGPNYPTFVGTTNPVITTSACSGAFAIGDIVILKQTIKPIPEASWEGSLGGIWNGVSGGGKLLSNTTDLCASCGQQTLNMDGTTGTSGFTMYADSSSDNIFRLMNGTFQLSVWAKTASGSPTLTLHAHRLATGGFDCGSNIPTLTSTWTQFTYTCSASETQGTTQVGPIRLDVTVTGGAAYLDNVDFEQTGTDATNTTVFTDAVINDLATYNPGFLRYWVSQNGETVDNWTLPNNQRSISAGGTGYFALPTGSASNQLSLEDYLNVCKKLGTIPYLELPVTISTADAANLVNFLAGTSGTYAARRIAFGQTAPWPSVFPTIDITFCNECWNFSSFAGQALPARGSAPASEYYYDYSVRAGQVYAAMRAASDWTSVIQLGFNVQTAVTITVGLDTSVTRAKPDFIEGNGYTDIWMPSCTSDAGCWTSPIVGAYLKAYGTTDPYSYHTAINNVTSTLGNICGASGTAACQFNVYEWGNGVTQSGLDQTHMDHLTAGAGEAAIYALNFLGSEQTYGLPSQSAFSFTEYVQSGSPRPKLWGNIVDAGGATNNVRPDYLGMQLVNQAIGTGSMYSAVLSSAPTFNYTANSNGADNTHPVPSTSNVPYLYSWAFKNGSSRSLVLINTDLSASHTFTFAGTNPPTGTVTVKSVSASSVNSMNEAATGTPTNTTAASVSIASGTVASPSSVTVAPYTVETLSWVIAGGAVATPTFTPSTLSAPGWVTISSSTPSSTCFYTTDGSTPTTSSTQVIRHLYIAMPQNLQAICSASGLANSAIGSQAYSPTFQSKFYISANGASDIPSPYPFINRSIAAEWLDLLSNPADCNTYNFAPLTSWLSQSTTHGSVNLYTVSHIPQCANGTTNSGNPPTDISSGNTFVSNFVDKLWEHLGGLSSVPGSPTSYTNYSNMLYFELWNESNVGRYWTSTDANMAKMWTTEMTEERKFSSDTITIGGSVSAGGKGNEYYYASELAILQNLGVQKPDVVSFHPYPSRDNVQNVPFPDTNISNNSATCASGNVPNVSCDIPVASEVAYFRLHVLCDPSISSWACNLGVVTTEGGYGVNDGMCDGSDGDWTHANVQVLRGGYASTWEIALADQDTLFNLAYSNGDQSWMTAHGNGVATHPGGSVVPCTQPNFTGQTAVGTALNQTNTWLQSGTITGPKTCSTVTGGQVCKLPMSISGNLAEIDYFTGWLTSSTQSTTFPIQQNLAGTTSATGGSVTLSQQPVLLTGTTSTLTVSSAGTGTGTISGTNCSTSSPATGTVVTCSASPAIDSTFAGWSGTGSASGCSGTGGCTFTLSANSTVTAMFNVLTYTLTTSTIGSGSLSGSNCTTGTKSYGTSISCIATPSGGFVFTGWSGGTCSGTGSCAFSITANATVTATFTASATPSVTLTGVQTFKGSVIIK